MRYEYQDFSKADKKLFEPLLDKSIKNEIRQFLNKQHQLMSEIVNQEHEDIRQPYWKVSDKFQDFSKYLTRTYDNGSHRNLPWMVTGLRFRGALNEDDFNDFSESGKAKLDELKELMERINADR